MQIGNVVLPHIKREVGMSQVVELASDSEGFAEHGRLPPAAGGVSRRVGQTKENMDRFRQHEYAPTGDSEPRIIVPRFEAQR